MIGEYKMDFNKEIVRILEKYNTKLSLQQICDYIETENQISLSNGRKLIVRQWLDKLSNQIRVYIVNGVKMYDLIPAKEVEEVKSVSLDEAYKKNIKVEYVRPNAVESKLFKRIRREFPKCTYIGDISISEEEYGIVIKYLTKYINTIDNRPYNVANIFLATSLVQLGIKKYDRAFWSHLESETGISKIDRNIQTKLGCVFYNTLVKYDKIHLEKNEIVNNILMHCFIATNYAEDFFDFLFAYYSHDLDRDLTQNTPEMMGHLIDAMKKADNHSLRTYKIKKHTADAVMMNEKGCKIRINNVLKYIDAYVFDDRLPEKSPNRVAKLFVNWAKESEKFALEKSNYASVKMRSKKRFHSPYINFNLKTMSFRLALPVQTIHTEIVDSSPVLSWRITGKSFVEEFNVDCEESVIGYKTADVEFFDIKSECLFETIYIELLYNGETKKSFSIKSDSVRFFDLNDYNYIKYDEYIRSGNIFAVTLNDNKIESEKITAVNDIAGLKVYQLELENGDIIKLPSGHPLSVGRPLEEGIVSDGFIKNAFVENADKKYSVYSKAPSLYFKMTDKDKKGTILIVNGIKFRFDESLTTVFNRTNGKTNYILDLKSFCNTDGIYNVSLNIPSERKVRNYEFAVINGLKINFKNAPYIYVKRGELELITKSKNEVIDFIINPEEDYIKYHISQMELLIVIPVFKWKDWDCEGDVWRTESPEIIWYKEFPEKIYFKFPDNIIKLFGDNVNIDVDKNEIILNANRETQIFECDTTKIPSWWYGTNYYLIKIGYENESFNFLKIITRNILNSTSISCDPIKHKLNVKSDISGFNDCVADVKCNNEIIAEKVLVKANGFDIQTKYLSGEFEVVFYEYDSDEEDEFGLEASNYTELGRVKQKLKNDFDIDKIIIQLKLVTRDKKQDEWFDPEKYILSDDYLISDFKLDDENEDSYVGTLTSQNHKINGLRVSVRFIENSEYKKAEVKYYDDEAKTFTPFIYDKDLKSLDLKNNSTSSRYVPVSNRFYFVTSKR